MCVGMCWPCHVLPPPRRACCTGAAPDPQSTAGLKACNREGKVNGMAGKGVECCVTLPFRNTVPKSLTRYQHDAFPGVSLCSSVFLPHLSLGSLPREGLSWACWHVGGYLIRGSPLSCRPRFLFLWVYTLLTYHVLLAHRNIPLGSASVQGSQDILNLPVVGRDDHGMASRRGPPLLHLLLDSQG